MAMPMHQCPQCQKIMNLDAHFCSDCGAKLPQVAQASIPAQQSISGNAKQAQPAVEKKVDASTFPSPSDSTSSDGPNWRRHVDLWNGFSLECPSGWGVRVTNNVIFVCQDTIGLTKAMIGPIQLKQDTSADVLARDLVKINQTINGTFKTWKMNAEDVTYSEMQQGMSTDQVLLRFHLIEEQAELIGVLSVMVDGNRAITSGFQAPAHMVEKVKPVFQRILASFQVETRLPRAEFVEASKKAFTASVPLGWQVTSRPFNTPSGIEGFQFRASDPEGKMSVEVPGHTYHFQEAAKSRLYPVMPYLPATAFLERVIVPEMRRHYANFQVESIVNRADWVKALVAESIREGLPIPGKRSTAASLQCTFTEHGVTYRQRTHVSITSPSEPGLVWIATIGSIVRAPLDQFAEHYMVLEGITESIRFTREWIQEQQTRLQQQQRLFDQQLYQQHMQLHQQIAANGQALIQGQMQRNQIMRNAQNYTFNVYQGAAGDQQRAFHQVNQAFAHNYIQGNEYVGNPSSGVVYDVPVGYRYHWVNRMGVML